MKIIEDPMRRTPKIRGSKKSKINGQDNEPKSCGVENPWGFLATSVPQAEQSMSAVSECRRRMLISTWENEEQDSARTIGS